MQVIPNIFSALHIFFNILFRTYLFQFWISMIVIVLNKFVKVW